jgi:hypothetical protein
VNGSELAVRVQYPSLRRLLLFATKRRPALEFIKLPAKWIPVALLPEEGRGAEENNEAV